MTRVHISGALAAALFATAPAFGAFAQSPVLDHAMLVVGKDAAAVYDVASGREIGRVAAPGGSLDTMALANGVALFNHTAGNQVIAFDLKTGGEIARIAASSLGGTRPVHAYLSPRLNGRQYYVVLNDGTEANTPVGQAPKDSSMMLVDVEPTSPTYLKPVGEVRLGRGHHKVAFSNTRDRAVVSNIGDCGDVLSVYDFANPGDIKLIKSFSAKDFGFDGSTPMRSCDETGRAGVRLGPHGVGTSALTGEAFHFITGTGQVAAIDVDSDTPSLKIITTAGVGGSTAKDMPGGRYIVVPQRTPRELQDRAGGVVCQVGQIAVIDAAKRQLVAQTPIKYGDGACKESLAGKPGAAASAAYVGFDKTGSRMFVALGTLGGAQNAAHTVDLLPVLDMSDPTNPRQMPPIRIEAGQGRDIIMSNEGRLAFVPNSAANSVSIIDTSSMTVVKTIPTIEGPTRLSTFSPSAGPSKAVGPASQATN